MHVGGMPQAAAGVLPLLPSMPPGALQQQQGAVRHGMQGPIQSMASLLWHPRAASLSALGHGLSASALHFGFDHLVVDADNNRARARETESRQQSINDIRPPYLCLILIRPYRLIDRTTHTTQLADQLGGKSARWAAEYGNYHTSEFGSASFVVSRCPVHWDLEQAET